MDAYQVIKKPLLSEKSYAKISEKIFERFTFINSILSSSKKRIIQIPPHS